MLRLGFNDESSLDYPYRHNNSSEEDYYDRSRGYGYQRKHRYMVQTLMLLRPQYLRPTYSDYRDENYGSSSRSRKSYETSSRHSSKYPDREQDRYMSLSSDT